MFGLIFVFVSYLKQIFEPIKSTIEKIEDMQEALVSINKIYEILEKKESLEDLSNGMQLKEMKGEIEFRDVWFSYNQKDWVLKGVSFKIKPGESVALVGKTGSRKNYDYQSDQPIL